MHLMVRWDERRPFLGRLRVCLRPAVAKQGGGGELSLAHSTKGSSILSTTTNNLLIPNVLASIALACSLVCPPLSNPVSNFLNDGIITESIKIADTMI